jgi:protein-tyrosine phosphatase
VSVLVVSTSDVCRAPLAVRLLTSALGVPVTSAGARAVPGRPACGIANLGDMHVSRRLSLGDLRSASLVLGMAREHLSAVVALAPAAASRAFTLLQAARLATRLSSHDVLPPAHLGQEDRLRWWVSQLDGAWRRAALDASAEDDLPDPHEFSVPHEVVLPRLTDAVHSLLAILAPTRTLT